MSTCCGLKVGCGCAELQSALAGGMANYINRLFLSCSLMSVHINRGKKCSVC